jgi:hypothetical protein
MKGLLGNEYMDYHGNGYAGVKNDYADYNRQTVVVGVFYTVLPKLSEEILREYRLQSLQPCVEAGSNTYTVALRVV